MQNFNIVGMGLSLFIVFGYHNSILLFICGWVIFCGHDRVCTFVILSIWLGESDIGDRFLSCFLCSPFRFEPKAGIVTIWLFRWLIFRITIGAGLIKKRGSGCWEDGTALHSHFETQPLPSPMSAVFHHLPKRLLTAGVWVDFICQLYTS
eukprot:UN25898